MIKFSGPILIIFASLIYLIKLLSLLISNYKLSKTNPNEKLNRKVYKAFSIISIVIGIAALATGCILALIH